jgi:hypothetical protein
VEREVAVINGSADMGKGGVWSSLLSLFHANVNIREALLSLSLSNADDVVGGGGRSAPFGVLMGTGAKSGQNPLETNDIQLKGLSHEMDFNNVDEN